MEQKPAWQLPGRKEIVTERERILTSIRGYVPDRLPWVPRLEFWYRARRRNGTLPAEVASLTLPEIIARLGVGYYANVPDFTCCPTEVPNPDRTIGIFNAASIPYEIELDSVDRRITSNAHQTVVEYHTPVGSIRTAVVLTEEMLDAGTSQPWLSEKAIREPRDFDVVGYIFSHLKVKPRTRGYEVMRETVGERGIAVAFAQAAASPVHLIMKDLMTEEQFFYAMADYPEKIRTLADQIEPFFRSVQDIAASTSAEVVFLGGNYDDSITHPAFFRQYILPALRQYSDALHLRGKFLMTHTDGENRLLLRPYLEAGFDVADSVCPAPMTRCSLDQILEAFEGRITLWGGIPSILLIPDVCSQRDFRDFVDGLIARHGLRPRFILGVSDMVTADADWERLRYITEKIASL